MPSGVVWTHAEETAFIQFLVDHKSEGGDGGSFKGPTYQKALEHMRPLRERGPPKDVKSLQNKWTSFKKTYRVILAIKEVSGWVWDNEKGANINVHSASSWDDYVKKHVAAKPFRNKGWPHFENVARIMPSTASGANVFIPTQNNTSWHDEDESEREDRPQHQSTPTRWSLSPPVQVAHQDSPVADTDDDGTPAPRPASASVAARKRAREPVTPTQPASKRVRASKGATALENMSTSLSAFGTTIANALSAGNGSVSARIDPTPIRRTTAIKSLIDLEKEWLGEDDMITLIDFLRTDLTAADTYITLTKSDVRQSWVRAQLRKLN